MAKIQYVGVEALQAIAQNSNARDTALGNQIATTDQKTITNANAIDTEVAQRVSSVDTLDSTLTNLINNEATARSNADIALQNSIDSKIGDLTSLDTTSKLNLVSALNEVNTTANQVASNIFDLIYPIGVPYVQFPGFPSPNDLWGSISTWTELDFGGAFFRASGGNAKAFGSGLQLSQNKSHDHGGETSSVSEKYGSANTGEMSGDNYGRVWCDSEGLFNGRGGLHGAGRMWPNDYTRNWDGGDNNEGGRAAELYIDLSHTHNYDHKHNITSDGGTEARPDNYTIRVWKRTA